MRTVLVTNIKGGCGKTTIATNLAAAFSAMGADTALADCDRQKSSLSWAEGRPLEAAGILPLDWTRGAVRPARRIKRLVIDAPAGIRKAQTRELVRMADIVILPVLPSVFDENATQRFLDVLDTLKPVRRGKRPVAVVGNRVRPRTRAAERLDEFFAETGHDIAARLRDTQIYPTAAACGLSLFDLGTKRAENYIQDWRPLLSYLDDNIVKLSG